MSEYEICDYSDGRKIAGIFRVPTIIRELVLGNL